MNLITVKTFSKASDAHLLKLTLQNKGIPSALHDEHLMDINPLFNQAIDGVKLKVRQQDYSSALEIINAIENTEVTDDEGQTIVCPSCGSKNYYSDFNSMRKPLGFLSAVLSLILSIYPLYAKKVKRCKNCDEEF